MKYFLLSVSKNEKLKSVNIGDYVQALASSQYYPRIDGFLDRDEDLKDYDGEEAKMIMNGWYMHNPKNWPPSNKIHPLFVAFHLNLLAKKELTSPDSIAYLKKHEPIGCRDFDTMNTLKSYGVDAYFSGCMTLTLGKKYKTEENDGSVYIVDPKIKVTTSYLNLVLALIYALLHLSSIKKLMDKNFLFWQYGKFRIIYVVNFFKQYSKVFGKQILLDATYLTQESPYYQDAFKNDSERLDEAKRLIKGYAKASLVITSRIHCALPCLGIGTPVIYTENDDDAEVSQCRLRGLKNLFNVLVCKDNKVEPHFEVKGLIDKNNHPENKKDWITLFDALDKRCTEFMKD